jgi:hypothetical protein
MVQDDQLRGTGLQEVDQTKLFLDRRVRSGCSRFFHVQAQPFNVAQCQSSNKVVDTAERAAIIAELNRAGPRFTPRKACYIKMQINRKNNG